MFDPNQKNLLMEKISKLDNTVIGFTNGCFDILHVGHVLYLSKCKKFCDVLILGLNTDYSIKKLKGKERPINDFYSRGIVLENLKSIDFVIGFNEETPLKLIDFIKPNILFKGKDYKINQVIGSDLMKKTGGLTKLIDFEEGYSTTKIIDKIRKIK